jgi:undecaprenol kinase
MAKFKAIEPQKYDRKTHNISFKYAWNGIRLAFITQPNFRFHILFMFLVVLASIVYQITVIEFLILLLTGALVICMEMVNTVVEAVGDEISEGEYSKLVGVAKDVAAGGVLVAAMFAIIIGTVIFLPKAVIIVKASF